MYESAEVYCSVTEFNCYPRVMAESEEITTSEGVEKRRLSLSRKNKKRRNKENREPVENSKRFALLVVDETMRIAKQGVVPSNTRSSNQWALKNFNAWTVTRNARNSEQVPDDLLESHDAKLVCKWLCYYVQETRKEDGDPYPPKTLKQLLCGIKRLMDTNKVPFNIFDKSNLDFLDLHLVCDTVCSDLLKQGIGATVNHADVILLEHEERLWELGFLGCDNPQVLQNTIFFMLVSILC